MEVRDSKVCPTPGAPNPQAADGYRAAQQEVSSEPAKLHLLLPIARITA